MNCEILSFREAAKRSRMGDSEEAGRRLRDMILAKERQLGKRIAVRGAGAKRPLRGGGIVLTVLYEHLPELAPSPAALSRDAKHALLEEARGYLREFDEKIARAARSEAESAINEIVQPQINELRGGHEEVLELCAGLGKRLSQLAGEGP